MLTGDKIETATCIAISTGLKSQNHRLFFIRDNANKEYVHERLLQFKEFEDCVLIIDGDCLEICLKYLEQLFFEVSLKVNISCYIRRHLLYAVDAVQLKKQL